MSIFQAIKDIFDALFRSKSPEVQKNLKLRKIEAELRNHPSGIYKSNLVQPNFAEALRIVFENSESAFNILGNTISTGDAGRNSRFVHELVVSCCSPEDKRILDSLSYEARKKELMEAESSDEAKIFEEQRAALATVTASISSPKFPQVDLVVARLLHLFDLCRFNYMESLQMFDASFRSRYHREGYVPDFVALPVAAIEDTILDFYYLAADFSITMSMGNALLALRQLMSGSENTIAAKKELFQNLRRIQAVLKHTLNTETLQNLACIAKGDPSFVPQKASYNVSACRSFTEWLGRQFSANDSQIRNDIKDNYVKQEIAELFPNGNLENMVGYNSETMEIIGRNSPTNFLWVLPMRVLKTFLAEYYDERLRGMLNDIVVEGMFESPTKKSVFSETVYSVADGINLLSEFEKAFEGNGKYSVKLIRGYISDSHRDGDFAKKLVSLVDTINNEAKEIIQRVATLLYVLSSDLGDFVQESRRSSSEIVTNLKTIMHSSRNRDATANLEMNFHFWETFFSIIRNYVTVKRIKKD